jgi:alginate O-acetyltransferase complex protein AlgI
MIFSSPAFFLGFLPLAIAGFAIFGRFGRRSAIGFLGLISLVFYAQWHASFLFVLAGSILFNFAISYAIDRSAGHKRAQFGLLLFGILTNLTALGYFKYLFPLLDFFHSSGWTHQDWGRVALPLGISFFTFTQIAYLVDLKQGVAPRESFLSYMLFVTFFPHLIAGPIIHHKEMMPQFREERRYSLNAGDVSLGITWFTMGLFKKLIVADTISPVADALFANPYHAGISASWLGALAYSMQLYFDFSGYSDMAVGLARMFSIRFPLNFDSPYKADSVTDFWQRFHMTLTHYITNYVYSPILMWVSRRRQAKGKKNSTRAQATLEGALSMIAFPTIFTMFIAGVWHGAGFVYFIFGLMHGAYITINHLWRIFLPSESRMRRLVNGPIAVIITYFSVLIAEVMFRSLNVTAAISVYAGMFGLHGKGVPVAATREAIITLLLALVVVWTMPNTQEILGEEQKEDNLNRNLIRIARWRPNFVWWILTFSAFLTAVVYASGESTFLYFQF